MLQATPQILDDLDAYLPTTQDTGKIARFFALLADQTRVRMLSALAIAPLCVTDLARVLKLNQTTVSHQLRLLRDVGIVERTRNGKILQYKIANPKINEILLVGVEYLGY
ncbi:MAG: winged helix-turn-helix transcriptional regulator [Clostridia bacterium]|nr:winged helix-turn-helix transcriptional regulator [Clostridia bacterium]